MGAWNLQLGLLVFVGLVASVEDLRFRHIPNWLSAVAFAGGLAISAMEGGWRGLGSSLLGGVAGFAVFLFFHLFFGRGAGDVKLMAGFGAILGAPLALTAVFWASILGGIGAALVVAGAWIRNRLRGKAFARPEAIPYGPAIALGAWLSLIGKS